MPSSEYGEAVKKYRTEQGMSQEELAHRVRLSAATVSKLEEVSEAA